MVATPEQQMYREFMYHVQLSVRLPMHFYQFLASFYFIFYFSEELKKLKSGVGGNFISQIKVDHRNRTVTWLTPGWRLTVQGKRPVPNPHSALCTNT